MSNFNWGIIVWMVIAGLVCGTIGYFIAPEETAGLSSAEINAKISEAVEQAIEVKDTEIERLMGLLEKTENETTEEEKILLSGYLIDGLFLNTSFEEEDFSDREISTLFDGEVHFDGDDYDAKETLTLKNIILRANDNDFEGVPYLVVPKDAIKFGLVFDGDLDTNLIGVDEETLVFSLFGEDVEVSEWNEDEITFTKGKEVFLEQGESITIDEKVIVLEYVTDDAVYVEVDGIGKSIDEDNTRTVNGIEIKVKDVFASSTYNVATLVVGTDIKEIISHGDEYEEDSIWEWIIDNSTNTIGLVLVEEFAELDKDFNALTEGDKICLPNDYVCVLFNGMSEEETEGYAFDLYDDYIRVKGDFYEGYDRVYIDRITGLIYEDNDLKLEIGKEIRLGDTEPVLNTSTDKIVIEDFDVNFDLNESSAGTDDEDYLTNYGILVENPKDSIEENEFTITIPEEKLEGSISILNWKTMEEAEDTAEEVID